MKNTIDAGDFAPRDYDFVDFDERDERDARKADRLREVVYGVPARPGTKR